MRIACPFCGERDVHEFVRARRTSTAPRGPIPAAEDAADRFFDYAYIRKNPTGANREHWYHASGCRRWLLVERNVTTHAILSVTLADGAGS